MVTPIRECPFEEFEPDGIRPFVWYGEPKDWRLIVIENKYPVFTHHEVCPAPFSIGPYQTLEGAGRHDLVITRDHKINFPELPPAEAKEVFDAFITRYRMLAVDPCLSYVSIFQNWGRAAGASQYHPHFQMIALPVIPPDVAHSLHGSRRYFHEHHRCVHCQTIHFESRQGKRVIFENSGAIAFAPYASKVGFQLNIFPKHHNPDFSRASNDELNHVVAALQKSLRMLGAKLNDPDYNFFIHTAPIRDQHDNSGYHWHIEIIPKTNVLAGFELGTGIIINQVDPDLAAAFLRS